jgi:hypothetical protein
MEAAAKIIAFRELLKERFPEAHAEKPPESVVRTGLDCLDAAGLTAGSICEIVAEQKTSAGAGLVLVALLEGKEEACRQPVALIDAVDTFDPCAVSPEVRERLLWVRCREVSKAVQAADLLLRDGNIPRVLMDLQLCKAREVREVPAHVWHRLKLLAEKTDALLCAFTPFQTVPCARSRIVLEQIYGLEALDVPRERLLASLQARVTRGGALSASQNFSYAAAG